MARVWPFNAADYLEASEAVPGSQWGTMGKSTYTISFWLKLNGHGLNQQTLVARFNGVSNIVRMSDVTAGKLSHFWIDIGNAGHDAIGATTVSVGVWHHVAATLDAATTRGRIYLDGVMDGTALAVNNVNQAGPAAWRFGLRNSGTVPADATMCEFAFWQTELSAAEIVALAKGAPPAMFGRTLVAYWPMFGPVAAEAPYGRRTTDVPVAALTGALAQGSHAPVMWPVPA